MYRRLLHDQIDLVRSGGEPAGVIRDRALNEMISFSISAGLEHLSRKLEATM